ncbi:hypothetical protein [Saccharothrix luteola]|uniref:hypothetical protein n=1 Tax=Saccharothrix luteola TaxID=2893018 RepID=UPI001E4DAD6D|nr:hypothetical protein [Saccharothrix luteola]MCC8245541.1 hypothetical protein [Saccharothrix luteola]
MLQPGNSASDQPTPERDQTIPSHDLILCPKSRQLDLKIRLPSTQRDFPLSLLMLARHEGGALEIPIQLPHCRQSSVRAAQRIFNITRHAIRTSVLGDENRVEGTGLAGSSPRRPVKNCAMRSAHPATNTPTTTPSARLSAAVVELPTITRNSSDVSS